MGTGCTAAVSIGSDSPVAVEKPVEHSASKHDGNIDQWERRNLPNQIEQRVLSVWFHGSLHHGNPDLDLYDSGPRLASHH
jgi:hypothetical protein